MKKLSSILLMVISLVLLSCNDKNEDPGPQNNTEEEYKGPTGPLMLHLHNFVGVNEVQLYNITYKDEENLRVIYFDTAQFYLSNFELVRLDGSIYKVKDTVFVLKLQGQDSYTVANVPVGNYKSINFSVGLNPTLSKKIPTSSSKDLLNRREMWFGTTEQERGYAYLNISGKIGTIENAEDDPGTMYKFQYKIGTNANYVRVEMPQEKFTVVEDGGMIHMYADLSMLFKGILPLDNKDNLFVKTVNDNESELAKKIVKNIPSMFKYENPE